MAEKFWLRNFGSVYLGVPMLRQLRLEVCGDWVSVQGNVRPHLPRKLQHKGQAREKMKSTCGTGVD